MEQGRGGMGSWKHGRSGHATKSLRFRCGQTAIVRFIASKSTAKALSDIAMGLGPPISKMQSTPQLSVSSRAFAFQSGVSV